MVRVRKQLSRLAPDELLLLPLAIVAVIGVLLHPGSITGLFESPYATPAVGQAPADVLLARREQGLSERVSEQGKEVVLDVVEIRRGSAEISGSCPASSSMTTLVLPPSREGNSAIMSVCMDPFGVILPSRANTPVVRVILPHAPSERAAERRMSR